MYCPVCRQPNPDDALYCQYCRTQLRQNEPPQPQKDNSRLMFIISIAATAAIIAATVITIVILLNKDPKDPTEPVTEPVTESSTEETTEEETTDVTVSVIQPQTESASTTTTKASSGTEAAPVDWQTAPANQLYQPPKSYYLSKKYTAYVYCTDPSGLKYVYMLYGPSDTSFIQTEISIYNYDTVTVETKAVNGWLLCSYKTKTGTVRGWILASNLFSDKSKVPAKPAQTAPVPNGDLTTHRDFGNDYVRAGYYRVSAGTGYSLALLDGYTPTSGIVYYIPDGTEVKVQKYTYYLDGLVYVFVDDIAGHHEGFVDFQYLRYSRDK